MNNVRKILLYIYIAIIAAALLMVALYENETCLPGYATGQWPVPTEFAVTTIAELLTIALIPLALRLFKFASIDADLRRHHEQALLRWAIVRLAMLGVPLLANTALYYALMNTSFGYMAIIVMLTMPFVCPTKARCDGEAHLNEEEKEA